MKTAGNAPISGRHGSASFYAASVLVFAAAFGIAAAVAPGSAPGGAGHLIVNFLYMPPTEIEPTYHTAMWLEDKEGKLVKTLFVSQELSRNEFRQGDACPDWVKQASWAQADPSLVDAVTGPTPNVGGGTLSFNLDELGVAPGTYRFCFQVHIVDKYNILFRGMVDVGQKAQEVKIDVLYSPGKPPGAEDIVRDVQVNYMPAGGN